MNDSKIKNSTVLARNPDYSPTILPDGNWIFFNSKTNQVVVTSPTAGVFWELCTGRSSVNKIIKEVAKIYPEQNIKSIRDDVSHIIPTFLEHKLLYKQIK